MDRKKRFLFLCNGFYPHENASTICMNIIVQEIKKMGHDVDFFVASLYNDEINKVYQNSKIFYFKSPIISFRHWIEKGYNNYSELPKWKKILIKVFNRTFSVTCKKTYNVIYDTLRIKPFLKQFAIEEKKNKYDYIINISHPFSLIKVARAIKKKYSDIYWTMYMLDPYVYNYDMKKPTIKRRIKYWKKYTKGLDNLILTRWIYEENVANNFDNGFGEKMISIELPNLYMKEKTFKKYNYNTKIECIFTGGFYESIRKPDKMLDIFSRFEHQNIILTLLGYQQNKIVESYREKLHDRLTTLKNYKYDEYLEYVLGANILINVSNNLLNQVPSKVFEYISLGKPIINFYNLEEDRSCFYLKRYPFAYNFNTSEYTQEDIKGLEKFILANQSVNLTFEDATINLQDCLSENVCRKFIESIIK